MLTIRKLWTGLSREGRETACFDLAKSWQKIARSSRKALAQAINFRERTFDTTQVSHRASLLQQAIPRLGHRDLHTVLFSLREIRENMAKEFNKIFSSIDTNEDTDITDEKIKECIARLTGRWSVEDLWLHSGLVYILSSKSESDTLARKIFNILDKKRHLTSSMVSSFSEESTEESQESIESFNKGEGGSPELNSPNFTTLDNVLIRTIVSSLNHVEGVLSLGELDDLAGELTELNDSRERSWFHRGFVDNLLQRELQAVKSGDNMSRRTWYVTGHLVASMRRLPESNRPALIKALASKDVELLKDPANEAAAQFFSLLLKPLLEQGEIEEANAWIAAHGEKRFKGIVKIVREWARSALFLIEIDPGKVRSVLDTTGKFFKYDIRNSRSNMENINPASLHRLDCEIRYLRAISFRMEGQLKPADNELKYLMSKEESPSRQKDLWVQRALVKIGIRRLGHLHIPPDKEERKTFVKGILSAKDWLEKAVEGDNPSPIALVLMALPEVVAPQKNGEASKAKERLDRAIDIMQPPGVQLWESGEGSLGEETYLLTKARFYSTLLDLRTMDDDHMLQAQGQSLVTRLQDLFHDDRFPADLEIEAVEHALLIDAPGIANIAVTILSRHGYEVLKRSDIIVEASRKSEDFRKNLIDMLEDSIWRQKLTPSERWDVWKSLLQGCNDARDTIRVEHALDALQGLSRESSDMSQKFISLLQGQEKNVWSPAWEEEDKDDALFHCFIEQGDIFQAVNVLVKMGHREITNQRWQEVDNLLELLNRYDPEGNGWQNLKHRRDAEYAEDDDIPNSVEYGQQDTPKISIVFVGGNEIQKRYVATLSEQLADEDPYVSVSYHFTDWSSNWSKTVGKISNELENADAMVLMRFMRTGLGRRLRPMAKKHGKFWTPCTGHGRDSMKRSILEAASIVRMQRNKEST